MKGGVYPSFNKQRNKTYYKVKFPGVKPKTLASKEEAEALWITWNYKDREGTLDPRDYENDSPMQVKKLAKEYLDEIEKRYANARKGSRAFGQIKREIDRFVNSFGERNIKTLDKAEINTWIYKLKPQATTKNKDKKNQDELSLKTRDNIKTTVNAFVKWAAELHEFVPVSFPKSTKNFTLEMRNTIGIDVQTLVIQKVWELYGEKNPKVALACEWLSRYVGIRPVEMIHMKEKHVNISGFLMIENTMSKEKETKLLSLTEHDLKMLETIKRGDPEQYFFRHPKNFGRAKKGEQFAEGFPYKCWKLACKKLGVKNVDLYGGTRHSTLTALSKTGLYSKHQLMAAGSMHKTNKAAERYIQAETAQSNLIYSTVQELQNGEVISLEEKRKEKQKRSTDGLRATGTLEQ